MADGVLEGDQFNNGATIAIIISLYQMLIVLVTRSVRYMAPPKQSKRVNIWKPDHLLWVVNLQSSDHIDTYCSVLQIASAHCYQTIDNLWWPSFDVWISCLLAVQSCDYMGIVCIPCSIYMCLLSLGMLRVSLRTWFHWK